VLLDAAYAANGLDDPVFFAGIAVAVGVYG